MYYVIIANEADSIIEGGWKAYQDAVDFINAEVGATQGVYIVNTSRHLMPTGLWEDCTPESRLCGACDQWGIGCTKCEWIAPCTKCEWVAPCFNKLLGEL